ncbi:DUF4336 domain-containing protein [Solimonas sp. K1W22B-7]|uniref:DUF4336 domain-containing protein n=1 Tax=Solimonas sp. K1W22B-7 TaxID=2303331 RepID=UPI000E3333D7|nr:DUF4336 domain-containing protein [Solimonas sp. K1W22B-7]AXQ29546.1 DUF4336 domain-containing protein [Solimonas sp. K1W22B-7]
MTTLTPVAEGIWCRSAPQNFFGFHVGTRMTVVRLTSGGLLLHSPVSITPELRAAIDELGPVRHIVCPNLFHHLYAGEALAAWPQAVLHGPEKLQRKRGDLKFGATLTERPHPDWGGDFELVTIEGCLLGETAFYHRPTRSLIACDLVENFAHSDHLPTRWYLRLGGILGEVGWHRMLRLVYVNRRKARASFDRILQWPFERLVLAHGDVLEDDAREKLRKAMNWL